MRSWSHGDTEYASGGCSVKGCIGDGIGGSEVVGILRDDGRFRVHGQFPEGGKGAFPEGVEVRGGVHGALYIVRADANVEADGILQADLIESWLEFSQIHVQEAVRANFHVFFKDDFRLIGHKREVCHKLHPGMAGEADLGVEGIGAFPCEKPCGAFCRCPGGSRPAAGSEHDSGKNEGQSAFHAINIRFFPHSSVTFRAHCASIKAYEKDYNRYKRFGVAGILRCRIYV